MCVVMLVKSLFNLQESMASLLRGTSHSKVPSGLICVADSSQIKKPLEDFSSPTSCKGITLFSLTTRKKVFGRRAITAEMRFDYTLYSLFLFCVSWRPEQFFISSWREFFTSASGCFLPWSQQTLWWPSSHSEPEHLFLRGSCYHTAWP